MGSSSHSGLILVRFVKASVLVHLHSLHPLFHFVEAMMEAREMSSGVLAVIAGTLGDVLLQNRKASESCFCVFLWKCLFSMPPPCPFSVVCAAWLFFFFAWLDHPDQFVVYSLPSVQSCTWGWWDPETNSSSALRIEASQRFWTQATNCFLA